MPPPKLYPHLTGVGGFDGSQNKTWEKFDWTNARTTAITATIAPAGGGAAQNKQWVHIRMRNHFLTRAVDAACLSAFGLTLDKSDLQYWMPPPKLYSHPTGVRGFDGSQIQTWENMWMNTCLHRSYHRYYCSGGLRCRPQIRTRHIYKWKDHPLHQDDRRFSNPIRRTCFDEVWYSFW